MDALFTFETPVFDILFLKSSQIEIFLSKFWRVIIKSLSKNLFSFELHIHEMKHVHKSWIVLLALHSFLICLTFLYLPLSHLLLRSCSSSQRFSLLSHIVTSKALTTTWQLIWLSFLLIDKVRHAPGLFLLSRGWIYLWYDLSLY